MTDEQIEAVWNAVDASDLDVHDRKLAMKLRCRFARAVQQASRRAALEECWNICNVYADRLKGSKETASGHVALILTADEIRKLGRESIET